jgi:hypothetical protein
MNYLFKLGSFLSLTALFIGNPLHAQPDYSLKTSTDVNYSQLVKGFKTPPSESRLRCYWWWLNSMATKESITRDLEEMKAKGYGGASLVDAGSSSYDIARKTEAGPVFMSPEWMELYKHAVKEADRVGIELSVNIQSGWNPGGPSITPEFAMKKLVWSEIDIQGGKNIKIKLPHPKATLWYKDIIVQAVRKIPDAPIGNAAIQNWDKKSFNKAIGWKGIYPLHELRDDYPENGENIALKKSDIIDITANFKDSIIDWNAPAGEWTIIRYGYTCTGASTSTTSDGWSGLSLDHLSAEAFELFSKTVITPLIETAKSAGNSVKLLQTDSWEMSVVSWTKYFPEEFKKLRGYDIFQYLPVLTGRIVQNRDISNRFLHDFRKTVGDCVEKNHYQLFYDLAHKHGMGIHPESGGPHSAPVDALKIMAISDFPQGEFWAMANTHRIKDDERLSVRQSACVAHTNGKRFVAAEGPTSIGPQWERAPKDLKGNIDRVFCTGVNRIVWHTFTSSPKEFGLPGNEYFAGTHLNPNVTWWNKAGDFINYLNRCSYMLQQGLFVADVLYYYGDDVPNFVFLKEELPELKSGYDWDKCSKDVILNHVSFHGNKIVLPDGMSYRIMMLAPEKSLDLAVLKKLETLVKQGMTLIAPQPKTITGLTNTPDSDTELQSIVKRMWGKIDGQKTTENKYGKGHVIWGKDVNEVLAGMNVKPDFQFKGANEKTALDYIHRTTKEQDVYFVSNRFSRKEFNDFQYRYLPSSPDRFEQVECSFRITGMVPEIWNPITGETHEIPVYREENGYTIIPLWFEPEGSRFIVFKKSQPKPSIVKIVKNEKAIFPGNTIDANDTPILDFLSDITSTKIIGYQTGKYSVSWSNGKVKTFDVDSAFKKNISENWDISFTPGWGTPEKVNTKTLKSWTEFEDPGIKYYSGTAKYTRSFLLTEVDTLAKAWILDLGNLQEMASVKINGHQLQVLWSAPYRYNISSYIKTGKNDIEVEVVNMWVNRLIGDGKLPKEQRLTKTNVNKFDSADADKYMRVSGMLGPVTITAYPLIKMTE